MSRVTLADIARALKQPIPADSIATSCSVVTGVAALADAGPTDVSMITSDRYLKQFARTPALAIISQRKVKLPSTAKVIFVVDDVEEAVAVVLKLFAPQVQRPAVGIDSSANVPTSAKLGNGCAIGPQVVIGQRCTLGCASPCMPV